MTLNAANVSGGTGAGFTSTPTTVNVDNSSGSVTLNAFQIGSSPTGTFTVATLVFTPAAVGSSNLTLTVTSLTGTTGNDLPRPPAQVTLSNNAITVSRLP